MNKKDLTTKVAKRKRVTFHQRNDTCLFYLSIADQSLGIGGRRCFILGGWGGVLFQNIVTQGRGILTSHQFQTVK